MNLSDNQKRALSLLALGPDYAPKGDAHRKAWGRLMGKLVVLGYATRGDDPRFGEAYALTEPGRHALALRLREAGLMVCHCATFALRAANPGERQRWEKATAIWQEEVALLGGMP